MGCDGATNARVVPGTQKRGAFRFAASHPNAAALAIFLVVFGIYTVNPEPMWSGDLNSNSVFAFNVLEFRTIYLDAFVNGGLFKTHGTFSFTKLGPGVIGAGHWIPGYPVGTAVVTFPIYAVLYAYFKLAVSPFDVTSVTFEPYRVAYSHLAAAILSAGTVLFFFLISRRRFSLRVSLIATFCLAFATMQWGLLSQSLLQHGPSSFLIMASAYLALRADDSASARAVALLCASGALAGLLFLVRPTNLAFMAALLTFAALRFRARSVPFVLAFGLTFGLAITWNTVFFQSWLGPAATDSHSYNFALATFVQGFIGLAVSPIRGLIPNSPFLLFALTGMAIVLTALFRAVRGWDYRDISADALLFGMLLGASGVIYLSYSFSPFWEGGAYGSRYLSETTPILVYFLNFSPTLRQRPSESKRVATVAFALFVAIGVAQQVTAIVGGGTGQGLWAGIPYSELDLPEDRRWAYMQEAPLRNFETRLWNVRDGLVERIWRGVYSRRFLMSPARSVLMNYLPRCKATIVSVADNSGRPVDDFRLKSVDGSIPYLERLWDLFSSGRKFVHVRIRNDGKVPLYGYETGLQFGVATMVHKVIHENGRVVFVGGTIHVSGIIEPGETGNALGSMEISMTPGRYRVEAQMTVNGLGYCGPERELGTVEVE
jgi:hypothetical protein